MAAIPTIPTLKAFSFESEDDSKVREARRFESGAAGIIGNLSRSPLRSSEIVQFTQGAASLIGAMQGERDDETNAFYTEANNRLGSDSKLIEHARNDTIFKLFPNEDPTPYANSFAGKIIKAFDTLQRLRNVGETPEETAPQTREEARASLEAKQAASRDIYGRDRPKDPLVSYVEGQVAEGKLRYGTSLETATLAASIAFIAVPTVSLALVGEAGAIGAGKITKKAGIGEAPGYWTGQVLTALATPLTLPEEVAFKALGKVATSGARHLPFVQTLLKRSVRLTAEAALRKEGVMSISGAADHLPARDAWNTISSGLAQQDSDLLREIGEGLSTSPIGKRIVTWVGKAAALARTSPHMRSVATYSMFINKWEARITYDRIAMDLDFSKAFPKADRERVWVLNKAGNRVKLAFEDIYRQADNLALTPEQRQVMIGERVWMDSLRKEFETVTGLTLEEAGFESANNYVPRIILNKHGKPIQVFGLGAKQTFEKPRIFDYIEDGIAAGIPYASPTDALRMYGYAIGRAIADDMFIDSLRTLPNIASTKNWLKAQRQLLYRVTKNPAIKKDDPLRYERAVQRLKTLGNKVSAEVIRPRVVEETGESYVSGARISHALSDLYAPESVMKDIDLVFGPGNAFLSKASMITGIARVLTTGLGDMGQFFIQGLPMLGRNPKEWGEAVYHSMASLADPEHAPRWLARNGRAFAEAGGKLASGTEFTRVPGKIGPVAIQSILTPPGLRRLPRSFETFVDVGRVLMFNSLADAGRVAPGSFEAMRLARQVDTMLGVTDVGALGTSTASSQAESALLFFSPRYTRSVFAMMAYLFSHSTAKEAARTLGGMTVGGIFVYAGLAKMAGMSDEEIRDRINPFSSLVMNSPSKLGSIPVGSIEYGIGGQYRANLATIAGVLNKRNWNLDTWEDKFLRNPIMMRMRSVQAPIAGRLVDYIDGEDFLGQKVSMQDTLTNPLLIKEEALHWAPLTAQAAIEADVDWEERLGATALSFFGGRTRMISPWDVKDDVTRELSDEGVQSYKDADLPLRQRIDEDPRVIAANERIEKFRRRKGDALQSALDEVDKKRGVVRAEQEKLDAALEPGNADSVEMWRKETKELQRTASAQREQIFEDLGVEFTKPDVLPKVRAAVEAYFSVNPDDEKFRDPNTNATRWDLVDEAKEAALAGLTADERASVDKYLTKYMTPTQKAVRKAGEVLDDAPSQYQGMTKGEVDEYQRFAAFVAAKTRVEASQEAEAGSPGYRIKQEEVAQRVAAERNKPWLAEVFTYLQSEQGRNALRNPEYDSYLEKHRDEIEPYFPTLYSQTFFERQGLLKPEIKPVKHKEVQVGTTGKGGSGDRAPRIIVGGEPDIQLPNPRRRR